MARSLQPLAWVLCIGLVSACADRSTGSGEQLDGEPPVPELACAGVEPGALAAIATGISRAEVGPCGHIIYAVANQDRFLYTPGAASEAIDASSQVAFASTGRYAAWRHAKSTGLALRDLVGGEQLELEDAQHFGFVPAPGTEHGADLWGCLGSTLRRMGPASPAVVAEGVDCSSVVGSAGSPRVAFAMHDRSVHVAELESLELWELGVRDYEDVSPSLEGSRSHELWLDYRGSTLAHFMSREVIEPDVDASWVDALATDVYAGSEQVYSWSSGQSPPTAALQSPAPGAATLFRTSSGVIAIEGSELHQHGGNFGALRLDASGRAFMLAQGDTALQRLDADGLALETLVNLSEGEIQSFGLEPEGSWAALELDIEPCLTDPQGACEWLLTELALWHEGEGLREARFSGLTLELLALNDAGQLLAFGIPAVPGPTPDPLPSEQLLLLDAQLELIEAYPYDGGFERTVVVLDDGRFVVEMHQSAGDNDQVFLIDAQTGITSIPESISVGHDETWVSPAVGQLAFVQRDAMGEETLFAGALPP